jgi:hypothetical protein
MSISKSLELLKNKIYQNGKTKNGDIRISFYETKEITEYLILKRVDKVYFERWNISVTVIDDELNEEHLSAAYNQATQMIMSVMEVLDVT